MEGYVHGDDIAATGGRSLSRGHANPDGDGAAILALGRGRDRTLILTPISGTSSTPDYARLNEVEEAKDQKDDHNVRFSRYSSGSSILADPFHARSSMRGRFARRRRSMSPRSTIQASDFWNRVGSGMTLSTA